MERVMALTKELCEIKSGIVCEENEALFRRINQEIPLEIFRYNSGEEHNGWIIPDKWKVEEAKVFFDGELIYDGTINALGVAQYSESFEGEVDLETFKKHTFSIPPLDEKERRTRAIKYSDLFESPSVPIISPKTPARYKFISSGVWSRR